MDEAFIGSIVLFAGNFAPRGWAFCNGALLSVSQNTALFSILGTTYGGDGQTTFALPNLQGRVPVGTGSGVVQGQAGGTASVTLQTNNLPPHTHALQVSTTNGTASNPSGGVPAVGNFEDASTGSSTTVSNYAAQPNASASPQAIAATGNGVPVNIMPPYLGLNYIICLQGIYPSRS